MEPDQVWLCPISRERMRDPVIAADGHTYERAAIEQWLRKSATSPVTRARMTATTLIPNFALRAIADKVLGPLPASAAPASYRTQMFTRMNAPTAVTMDLPSWLRWPPEPLPLPPLRAAAVMGPLTLHKPRPYTEYLLWQLDLLKPYDQAYRNPPTQSIEYMYNELSAVFIHVYIAYGLAADRDTTHRALLAFQTGLIRILTCVVSQYSGPRERRLDLRAYISSHLNAIGEGRIQDAIIERSPVLSGGVQ